MRRWKVDWESRPWRNSLSATHLPLCGLRGNRGSTTEVGRDGQRWKMCARFNLRVPLPASVVTPVLFQRIFGAGCELHRNKFDNNPGSKAGDRTSKVCVITDRSPAFRPGLLRILTDSGCLSDHPAEDCDENFLTSHFAQELVPHVGIMLDLPVAAAGLIEESHRCIRVGDDVVTGD
jgi:hypothetical protein